MMIDNDDDGLKPGEYEGKKASVCGTWKGWQLMEVGHFQTWHKYWHTILHVVLQRGLLGDEKQTAVQVQLIMAKSTRPEKMKLE